MRACAAAVVQQSFCDYDANKNVRVKCTLTGGVGRGSGRGGASDFGRVSSRFDFTREGEWTNVHFADEEQRTKKRNRFAADKKKRLYTP